MGDGRVDAGIGEDRMYRNAFGSVLMFRCRTNTLKLRQRNRFNDDAADCVLCGAVEEIMEYFVMECGGLREIRERCGVGGGFSFEEALLFEGRTEERVE